MSISTHSAFKTFNEDLLEYQDRRERIIKLSRDCTALSKRLIFLLHRLNNANRQDITQEATMREEEILIYFTQIGDELESESNHNNKWIYKQSYTGGLQEYIEAVSFFHFLQEPARLITLEQVRKRLGPCGVHVSEEDYLLGLTDLTGELMRYGMNAIGNSGIQDGENVVRQTEEFVRQIQSAMNPISPNVRGLAKKLSVMNQSLLKLEKASYAIALRKDEYKEFPEALKEAVRKLNQEFRFQEEEYGETDEN